VKMAVFWVVAPCSLVEVTNVSEVLAASIIRAIARLQRATTQKTAVLIYEFCLELCVSTKITIVTLLN
jgi:hypothetical protein